MPFLAIHGPRDDHTKWSKSERGRQTSHDIPYIRNLKYDPNELIYETDSWTQSTDLWWLKGGGWERDGLDFGISRCKVPLIEWIKNKILLYSTGSYIQHSMINHNGKDYEKECIYIYMYKWFTLLYCYGEGNGTPLQYFCLENSMDRGAWWAAVHGVARVGHNWVTSLSIFTFTFHFHALEKEMATHSSVLAWRIPGTGEPGGLLSKWFTLLYRRN